jgi:hypothetical protein
MADINPGPEKIEIGGQPIDIDSSIDSAGFFRSRDTRGVAPLGFQIVSGDTVDLRRYFMRAWHTVLTDSVYWHVEDAPDVTGSQSPYTPGDLTDILGAVRDVVTTTREEVLGGQIVYGTRLEAADLEAPDPTPSDLAVGDFRFVAPNLPFNRITEDP